MRKNTGNETRTKQDETKPQDETGQRYGGKTAVAEAYVERHPAWTTRALARLMHAERPDLFPTYPAAEWAVRYVRGAAGTRCRKFSRTEPRKQVAESNVEEYLRHRLRELSEENRTLRQKIGSQEEFVREVKDAVRTIKPVPLKVGPKGRGGHEIVPVLLLGDWHIGETVSKEETGGFGEYNLRIAREGLTRIVTAFLNWVEDSRQFKCEQCVVIGLGDWISGDIREELRTTAEFPTPVQAVVAGELFAEVIGTLAGRFRTVNVWEVGGDNHGRLTRKPVAKQKATYNMGFCTYSLANVMLREVKNVVLNWSPSMKMTAETNGIRMICEHGDTVRAWMGVPWYGINREVAREAVRRMDNTGFRYLVTGHWHTPCFIEDRIIVNGSLSGTNEYDHACGRHSRPCQVGFMVSARHGVFNWTAFYRDP